MSLRGSQVNIFPLAVKSTIDRIIFEEAMLQGCDFFDLDGVYLNASHVESAKPAIAWSLLSLMENHRDPYYLLHFEVAAKTVNDESQYNSMTIISAILNTFSVGNYFFIRDYSKAEAEGKVLGNLMITLASTSPPGFDKVSSLRTVQLTALVQRFHG